MGRDGHKPFFGKANPFVRWSFILALNAALLIVVGISTARETYNDWKVDREMKDLQTQVEGLDGKRLQLAEMIQKLNAPKTMDQEARARLGMQKPGERVVVLRGADIGGTTPDASTDGASSNGPTDAPRNNPQRWFDYFFTH